LPIEGGHESLAKFRFGNLRIEGKIDVIREKELEAVEGAVQRCRS
jgi:hypothetical protein